MHSERKKFFYTLLVVIAIGAFLLMNVVPPSKQRPGQVNEIEWAEYDQSSVNHQTETPDAPVAFVDVYAEYGITESAYLDVLECFRKSVTSDPLKECSGSVYVREFVSESGGPVSVTDETMRRISEASTEEGEYVKKLSQNEFVNDPSILSGGSERKPIRIGYRYFNIAGFLIERQLLNVGLVLLVWFGFLTIRSYRRSMLPSSGVAVADDILYSNFPVLLVGLGLFFLMIEIGWGGEGSGPLVLALVVGIIVGIYILSTVWRFCRRSIPTIGIARTFARVALFFGAHAVLVSIVAYGLDGVFY